MFGLPEESTGPVGPAQVPAALAGVAARLPPNVRLGTSSWSFPGWEGLVYDRRASQQVLARRGLKAYAKHPLFRTVGVDRTYYAPVEAEVLARYADAVGERFRFLVKAHQDCTRPFVFGQTRDNSRFLDPAYAEAEVVRPFVAGLGPKGGPLLFQFPPLDAGLLGGPRAFARKLGRFLGELPQGPLYAVELRDRRLLGADYAAALRDTGAVHCFNAHPSMPPVGEQADLLRDGTGQGRAVVVRWMLARRFRYEEARERYAPFDRIVDADPTTRAEVAQLVLPETTRPVYVVVNNKAEGSSPCSVAALAEAITRSCA